MCTVLCAGAIQGGYDLPNVLNDNGKVHTAAEQNLQNVRKLYFRECDLNKNNKYKLMMPFHQSVDQPLLTTEKPFPRQCGADLGEDANYMKAGTLSKTDNMIVEVFAKSDGHADWVRVGIVHLFCHANRYVELRIICMDPIKHEAKSVFTHAMKFVKLFALGQAPPESTEDANTLYKYSTKHAYGTSADRTCWTKAGNFIVLDATTLRSMTAYMHVGFVFASRESSERGQCVLFDGTHVGAPAKIKGTKVAAHKELLDAYFGHCCDSTRGANSKPPSAQFSNPLWQAMQVLHMFKDNQSVQNVQKSFTANTSFLTDELKPEKVQGTPSQRFAYATFALLVSLALLYTDPTFIVIDAETDDPKTKGVMKAARVDSVCKEVVENRAANPLAIVSRAITDKMLELASDVKQQVMIPMVLRNDGREDE